MSLIRSKQLSKNMTGDFTFSGKTTFVQTSSAQPAVIISGSQEVVPTSIYSGSIFIAGLGTFADTGSNKVIDLGNNSF
jgi:hypothetical protein